MNKNKKKEISLSWQDFVAMGNPENAPKTEEKTIRYDFSQETIRIHLEKKGRGGKEVSIVKGFSGPKEILQNWAKELKKECGVGGSVKNNEIIIQGNNRDKILQILKSKGIKNIKLSGG